MPARDLLSKQRAEYAKNWFKRLAKMGIIGRPLPGRPAFKISSILIGLGSLLALVLIFAAGQKLILQPLLTAIIPSEPNLIVLEPENGTITPPMTIGSDTNASGGKYIFTTVTNTTSFAKSSLAMGKSRVLAATSLPPLPSGWPSTLQLGTFSGAGEGPDAKSMTPGGFRYQYLAGGVTGSGWATWNPNGSFATNYIQESLNNGLNSIFVYYNILQSAPANAGPDESTADFNNLNNTTTMTDYFNDFKLLLQKSAAFPTHKIVIQVEPDFWGFMQQHATNDDATTVTAKVSATGIPDVAAYPNNLAGFAQALVHLRDVYAPNVLLSYELSIWGTGIDIVYARPADSTVISLANRSANFYKSLGANFDLTSTDPTDRDAGFKQFQYNDGGASWWSAADYARHILYISTFTQAINKRIYWWQTPYGNTKMLAENNTWDHYQDNHVEWTIGDTTRANITNLMNAGLIGLFFGRGADGTTGPKDYAGDGVTNPPAINGNTGVSLSADDDGGYFRQQTANYYSTGASVLPGGTSPPPPPGPPPPPSLPTDTGSSTMTFNATSSGQYTVWTRMFATDANSDSYWLQIDGGNGIKVGDGGVPFGAWTWINHQNGDTTQRVLVNLSAGAHTIKIIGREANTKIDALILTSDLSFNPDSPPVVDATPPVVTISSPQDGASLSGTVPVLLTATDDHSVSTVDLLVDNSVVSTQTPPASGNNYTFNLDTTKFTSGSHTLLVKATDIAGNVGSSSILSVSISQPSPTPPPPPTPAPPPPPPTVVGDLNGDGKVNILDMSIMLRDWNMLGGPADLNHDGIVNIIDFSILLSHWTG